MILTLTPNPSLDLLFTADRLVWEDANRVPMPRRRPGGQGVNVVRAVRALEPEAPARAVAPLGGAIGGLLEEMLVREGTPLTAVPIEGETRVFVGVRERSGERSLLLNPRGPEVGAAEEELLLNALRAALEDRPAARARWLACCGSLLPGLPPDFYARAGAAALEQGWSFAPDCDGEALRLAIAVGADLVVPNLHEAERLLGRRIEGVHQAGQAARDLLRFGPSLAVVTLGAAGAVAASDDGCWHARTLPTHDLRADIEGGSAVGAGDAFLAALLLGLTAGAGPEEALTVAVAAGSGTLLSRGTDLIRRSDMERVRSCVALDPVPG